MTPGREPNRPVATTRPEKFRSSRMEATVLIASGGSAQAEVTAGQLAKAGYFCFNDGPSNWTHCVLERHFGNPVIPVKVLSEDESHLLGTEQLLREDIYSGQPCPQDGLDFWDFLGEEFPYFACHHFHAGHH